MVAMSLIRRSDSGLPRLGPVLAVSVRTWPRNSSTSTRTPAGSSLSHGGIGPWPLSQVENTPIPERIARKLVQVSAPVSNETLNHHCTPTRSHPGSRVWKYRLRPSDGSCARRGILGSSARVHSSRRHQGRWS
jgi:hypothetical protein